MTSISTELLIAALQRRQAEWRAIQAALVPDARVAQAEAIARIETFEECIEVIKVIVEQEGQAQ